MLTRDELMRHEAAGITTAAFPKTLRLGGIDCAASYLHEPGDAKDGVTVTRADLCAQPGQRRALRMAGARHAAGQGAGAAEELHQRPRSRLVPLPDYAAEFVRRHALRPGRACSTRC